MARYDSDQKSASSMLRWSVIGTILLIVVVCSLLWGCPQYNVYEQRLAGDAKLAEAESSKQIAVQSAIAKRQAAHELAEAEVTRADGAARANERLIKSLGTPENYLTWRYIQMLEESENSTNRQLIYVPTGNGFLPQLLEAGRAVAQQPAPVPPVEQHRK